MVYAYGKKDEKGNIVNQSQNAPHVERFIFIWDFLRKSKDTYRYVVVTDTRDVIFQKDPTEFLKSNLSANSIVCSSEGLDYQDEPWGSKNLLESFGPLVYDELKDKMIYNVGTIGGVSEYVKDMVFNILFNAINRPIPICDQAVYNVLIQTQPLKDVTYFAKQLDGWACQAGTTVDPSKIESFRPHLLEPEPRFEDGIVKTSLGRPFAIVHQYDRVPEWKEYIKQKYQQEELITFRTI